MTVPHGRRRQDRALARRRPRPVPESFRVPFRWTRLVAGVLGVIARIENPDVIATILEHVRVREAATTANPRAPPLNTEHPAARYQDRLP